MVKSSVPSIYIVVLDLILSFLYFLDLDYGMYVVHKNHNIPTDLPTCDNIRFSTYFIENNFVSPMSNVLMTKTGFSLTIRNIFEINFKKQKFC